MYNDIQEEILMQLSGLIPQNLEESKVPIDIGPETIEKIKVYLRDTNVKDIKDKMYSIKDSTKKIDFLIISNPIIKRGEEVENQNSTEK